MELIRRQAARSGLIDFTAYTFPGYRSAPHHHLIGEKLDAVVRGDIKRLLITAPPRHGKSELVSRKLPAFYIGTHPDRQVICAAYGDTLVAEFGRDVRNVITSAEYGALFPKVRLAEDSKAKDRWNVANNRGSYVAAGVGSGITGKGAHLLVIDDPVKDREAADSERQRETIWSWYRSVAYTRLEKDAAVILTLTRWHQDDLAGRILADEENGGEKWEKLHLPAIDSEGHALWPEKYPREVLDQIRRTIGPYEWSALYNGQPTPLEGALFKPDQIQMLDAEPAGIRWVRGWDLAATAGAGDWTAGIKMGMWNDKPVIADVVRLQGSPDQVERTLVATATRDSQACEVHIPQDPGQAGKAQIQYFTSKLSGFRVKSSPETGDKVTRASPLASQVNVGNVYMVRGAWNREFIEELRAFPSGTHDDQIDGASRAFAAIVATKRSIFSAWS